MSDELINRAPATVNHEELADRYRRRFNELDAKHAHWRTQMLNVLELGTVPRGEELIRMTVARIQGQRDELNRQRDRITELEAADCPSCAQMKQWYGPDGDRDALKARIEVLTAALTEIAEDVCTYVALNDVPCFRGEQVRDDLCPVCTARAALAAGETESAPLPLNESGEVPLSYFSKPGETESEA